MRLIVGNRDVTLADASDAERAWLAAYVTESVRSNGPDGYTSTDICYLDALGRFPGGLLPLVQRAAAREGFGVTLTDDRWPGAFPNSDAIDRLSANFRPYQREAVDQIVKHRRGIIRWPTGSGKSHLAAALPAMIPPDNHWLFVVGSKDLAHDVATRHGKVTGERARTIGGRSGTSPLLTCLTPQTAWARRRDPEMRRLLADADGIIIDEVHHVQAETYTFLADAAEQAYYRVGLSATPLDRSDGRVLGAIGHLGPIIHETRRKDLEASGWLVPASVKMAEFAISTWRGNRRSTRNYARQYSEQIMRNGDRNVLLAQIAEAALKPALVFCERVDHAQHLAGLINGYGIPAAHVDGGCSNRTRDEAIELLATGAIDVLVSTKVFATGVDIPPLRSVIVAGAGRATIPTVQRIGRGTRPYPGKDCFEVWDILDTGEPTFQAQARTRSRTYYADGHRPLVGPLGGPFRPSPFGDKG